MKNPQTPTDLRQLFLASGQYGIHRGNQLKELLWVKKRLRKFLGIPSRAGNFRTAESVIGFLQPAY